MRINQVFKIVSEPRYQKQTLLPKLSTRDYDMHRLRHQEGLTLQEIGARYNMSRQAVHKILKDVDYVLKNTQ